MKQIQLKTQGLSELDIWKLIFFEAVPRFMKAKQDVKDDEGKEAERELHKMDDFIYNTINEMHNPLQYFEAYLNNYCKVLSEDPSEKNFRRLFRSQFIRLYWIQKLSSNSSLKAYWRHLKNASWWQELNNDYEAKRHKDYRMKHPEEVRAYFRNIYQKRMSDPEKRRELLDKRNSKRTLWTQEDRDRDALRKREARALKKLFTSVLES